MKKMLYVKVVGIENENLKEIKKVENAIATIKNFARHTGDLYESMSPICEIATMQGEENKENSLLLSIAVEVEELEDIMGNIAALTEKLKTEIRKIDKAVITRMGKEPVSF